MPNDTARNRDLPGTIIATVFILIGALAWWDTTDMSDEDSYVFPRTVVILMIAFSLMLIARNLLRGGGQHHMSLAGSWPRRIGLVSVMFAGALIMPWAGFLPSGIAVFMALMLMAMYDPWTGSRRLVFPLVGLAVVAGFYVLFSELLHVPLPVGSLFE